MVILGSEVTVFESSECVKLARLAFVSCGKIVSLHLHLHFHPSLLTLRNSDFM